MRPCGLSQCVGEVEYATASLNTIVNTSLRSILCGYFEKAKLQT